MSNTRFAFAVAVAACLVLSAPFVGQIRGEIRRAFPGHFVLVVGGAIALGLVAALLAAVLRIRDRRGVRYGGILLSMALAGTYASLNAGENPESNVVELFHFLQYGLISFLFYRVWRPAADLSILLLPLLAALIVGTVEEWLQWFIPNRVGELKDVLLNLVAIGTGLLFSVSVHPPERWSLTLRHASRRRVVGTTCATVLALAAFFHVVHLGHDIRDPEIGLFDSRWPASELAALQEERREQWGASPPPVTLVRLSREDQYLTEGIQHVRERNELWERGEVQGAWLENRILEKYYEPVLDTPTHEGGGHRWSPEHRADAESRAAHSSGSYVSGAFPYRLYKWPRPVFWSGVIVALAVFVYVARVSETSRADARHREPLPPADGWVTTNTKDTKKDTIQ